MLPHQRNKVDVASMNQAEKELFEKYGKVPSKKDFLKNKLKERKYFDSGDYALSKAGKASDVGVTNIGSQHPLPENIPHVHTPAQNTPVGSQGSNGNIAGSPVKETSHLHTINTDEESAETAPEGTTSEANPVVEEKQDEATKTLEQTPGAVPIPSQG